MDDETGVNLATSADRGYIHAIYQIDHDIMYRQAAYATPGSWSGVTLVNQDSWVSSTYDRFDANIGPHYHFICERCGAIVDLELSVDESLNDRVNTTTPFTAQRHRIEFYGTCDRCRTDGMVP